MSIEQISAPAYVHSVTLPQPHTDTEIIATIISRPSYNSVLIIYTVQRQAFLLHSRTGLE